MNRRAKMSEDAGNSLSNDTKSLEGQAWDLLNVQKQYDKAIEICDEILNKEWNNVAAFQCKIAALREKRNFSAANKWLDKAHKIHPDHPGILSERAWCLKDQGKFEEAISAFDEVLKVKKSDDGIFCWKISLLRSLTRFEEAKKVIEEASRIFPANFGIRSQRGWLQLDQMQYDEAIKTFQEILEEDNNNELALQGKIASLRMKGQYTEATELANKALSPNSYLSKSTSIYSERVWIWFKQGKYEEAEADFKKILDLIPNDPSAHINLAWSLVRQETDTTLNEATKLCRKALELEPKLAGAFGCLGNIAYKQGRIRDAEEYFLRSIQVNAKKGHYADLGALYIEIGRYDEAKNKLDEALKYNPDDAYAHIEMGDLYFKTEKVKEAIWEFRRAADIDPYNPASFTAWATALMENNKLIDAEKVLRKAIRRLDETNRWELHLTLCRLLTRIGDETNDLQFYVEALEEVKVAIHLKPQHPASYFHGGVVRFKLEDYRNAIKNFLRCRDKDEYQFEAELNIRRIKSLIRRQRAESRASLLASIFLAIVYLTQLIAIWILRFSTDKISDTMLTVLVPILLGLLVVAVLLPWLSRLKMSGFEAELSEPTPKELLPSGPKGEIGFSSASPKSI